MFEYLSEIMKISVGHLQKGSHLVLLCRMEEGHITWKETNKLDRVRSVYAHRSNCQSQVPSGKKVGTKDTSMPFRYFQRNVCKHKGDHDLSAHL